MVEMPNELQMRDSLRKAVVHRLVEGDSEGKMSEASARREDRRSYFFVEVGHDGESREMRRKDKKRASKTSSC